MDTANAISGVSRLNVNVSWHSQNAPAESKAQESTPPSQDAIVKQPVNALTQGAQAESAGKDKNQDKEELNTVVKHMNDFLQMVRRAVEFKVDEDSGRLVVQVKDAETKQLIRQIPSEQMLQIAKQMDKLNGLLFEERA